ncbi:hypothetical protein NC652_034004 [Populus alba x Populus x berolinensis]|uniref:Uncharacterized protein n=1 Tax=Populus alba x Populus x berolinensis TaxID=444605 RepID=A0AAD6LUX2_9ROSI|nr:hypothetical protein NC652_034004 [Populus alba x Populus x berolinensis]KAJ6973713.1 hypothetical protein NC653_033910 [Populus alba x Populus x berolinensis]
MEVEDFDATVRVVRRIDGRLSSESFGFGEGAPFINEDTCNKAIYIYI